MQTPQAALTLVNNFLTALQNRELDLAASMLAVGVQLLYPGARSFKDLNEMVAFASKRYQEISKTITATEALSTADQAIVVYMSGVLNGVNLHGVPFSGVRFIDRFIVQAGKIVSQEVWNDLAESGVLTRRETENEPAPI